MKFKKGDIVEIISSQNIHDMRSMIGSTHIVKEFYCETEDTEWYVLDNNCYIWDANWLQQIKNFDVKEDEFDKIFKT